LRLTIAAVRGCALLGFSFSKIAQEAEAVSRAAELFQLEGS
jgi:hypothetical protein